MIKIEKFKYKIVWGFFHGRNIVLNSPVIICELGIPIQSENYWV